MRRFKRTICWFRGHERDLLSGSFPQPDTLWNTYCCKRCGWPVVYLRDVQGIWREWK